MGQRVVPTVQVVKRGCQSASAEGEGVNRKTPGNKDAKAQDHGKTEEGEWGSS